jgi:hypothetical protein
MILFPNIDLDIPFKGDRNYLHSTDLYDFSLREIAKNSPADQLKDVRLLFKSIASNPLRLTFDNLLDEFPMPLALLSFTVSDQKYVGKLFPRAGSITDRKDYDEGEIIKAAKLYALEKYIQIHEFGKLNYSLTEVIVAMNRTLHQAYFSIPGKWMFTELFSEKSLHSFCPNDIKLSLDLFSNTRLTRSSILLDDVRIGYICFSLLKGESQ